jgi:hypothetical protein
LESSTAALPIRKRQLDMSIDRLLPRYQLSVMISMLTTSAYVFRCTCVKNRERSAEKKFDPSFSTYRIG